MRIAAYLHHLDQDGNVRGVGKHMIHMAHGLAAVPGIDLSILTPRRFLAHGKFPPGSLYAGLPAIGLPLMPRYLHRIWSLLRQPVVDHWCPDADWVYCPLEIYVPARRPRLAVTVHDLHAFETDLPWSNTPAHRKFRARWAIKFRPILRDAKLLLAVSEFTRRRLGEFLGVKDERIAVVGNGVEDAFYAIADKPGAAFARPEGPYVLTVGGLTARKSGGEVIAVARALAQRNKDLRVLVAGGGEEPFLSEARAVPNLVHLGYVNEGDLPGLVRGSVASMLLSRYEGFGIPAAEAMAAGVPAIVSNHAALPGVVGDGGIVVDIARPESVAETIDNLHRDTGLRARHAELGRRRAAMYRWDACVERLVAALRERM